MVDLSLYICKLELCCVNYQITSILDGVEDAEHDIGEEDNDDGDRLRKVQKAVQNCRSVGVVIFCGGYTFLLRTSLKSGGWPSVLDCGRGYLRRLWKIS